MIKKYILAALSCSFTWSSIFSQTETVEEIKNDSSGLRYTLQEVEVMRRKESSYKNESSFSCTKTEMRVKDIPQSISSVTKELIEDRQALRLKEITQNVAGVNEFSVYDDITMRGFPEHTGGC